METPNRLAAETSPYLRQHAHNPVDWYPWGEEALARARAENRPLLVSIGYSACHWCHVMAHESFEDQETARLMNEAYVNVKVDREERPDLDQLYQGVVQLMGRGGGWPLTVFLTPALEPFYGGTYFPPVDRHGLPAFPKLLRALAEAFRLRPSEVRVQAEQFTSGLRHLSTWGLKSAPADVTAEDVRVAGAALAEDLDTVHGGFGSAPKFPNPMSVALLLRSARRGGGEALRQGALFAAERMAVGGIFDQLGGGFHRYSVDAGWRVPHFEKMLYDNAQLLNLYAEAQLLDPRPLWRSVASGTAAWLEREMRSASGAFYASQDADSEGEEGRFFTWTVEDFRRLLGQPLADLAGLHFGATLDGNFEHGRNVLEVLLPAATLAERLGEPLEEVEGQLAEVRARLFAAREGRVRPGRDDKVLAGWNGLVIRGLAAAARAFGRPEWAELAGRAASAVLAEQWRGGRLERLAGKPSEEGFVEDYGDFAAGLVALFQATLDPSWLEPARDIADAAVRRFWDEEQAAYRTSAGPSQLLVPTYALHDNAFPSGASTLTEAQVALSALTAEPRHLEQAWRYLRRMREAMVANPFGYSHLWLAADAALDGAAEVLLVGAPAEVEGLRRAVDSTWAPTVALAQVEPGRVPPVLGPLALGRERVGGLPTAYLCRDFSCAPPVTDAGALVALLRAVGGGKSGR
ncbi:MAG: thioredoxin domain-containing protein [Myxococcaceae bacterium]